uniref:WAT1-related protein n=1 Tax=Davidia involucrata TaxID=16924 RepID=A0A5B7AGT1_DAVIN
MAHVATSDFWLKIRGVTSSSKAKIIGTIVSISGAFIVTLYKGPPIIKKRSPPNSPHQPLGSTQSNWVIGGLFLAADNLLLPIWYIVQAHVVRDYPAELIIVFLYNLCTTAICATVCLIAEKDFSAWKVRPDISLVAILYSVRNSNFALSDLWQQYWNNQDISFA